MENSLCPEGAEILFCDHEPAGVAVYAMGGALVITNGEDHAQADDTPENREEFIEDAKAIVKYVRERTGLYETGEPCPACKGRGNTGRAGIVNGALCFAEAVCAECHGSGRRQG